jgi:hypothetical protein
MSKHTPGNQSQDRRRGIMTIKYCSWCGGVIWHDILTGFCCQRCEEEYEALLNAELQAVNN